MKRVLLAAGGTGGHLLPGLAVAKALRGRGHRVHFAVKKDETTQDFLAKEGFPSSAFHFTGFPRRLSFKAALFPFAAAAAYAAAARVTDREEPDAVVGMGGYVSVPVGLAAARRNLPILLHEQNVRAGLANRFLSRWARLVAVSFEATTGLSPKTKTFLTGLPLRPDLVPKAGDAARVALGLDPSAPTLLVFGGSQGAKALNRLALEALPMIDKAWQFIHLPGRSEESSVDAAYKTAGRRAFVRGFFSDMATVYSAADFVVSRSGANSVMELARMGKSALLVPFPFATDDHQAANAREMEQKGLARVILERDLTAEGLAGLLRDLPPAEGMRRETDRRLAAFDLSAAAPADKVADLVESL